MLKSFIEKIQQHHELSIEDAKEAAQKILSGKCEKEDITHFLTALHEKGESSSEVIGFALAMRKSMTPIQLSTDAIDLCGTGGYTESRFNISTSAAFLLASLGIPVGKHGNRGSRKSNGSFDFLEALGIPIELTTEKTISLFEKTKIAFLFARNHHPAARFAAEARKELPFRTIFNLIGPLCNPASVTKQVVGTNSKESAEKLATALQVLGSQHAIIVVGPNGLDELSIEKPSLTYDITPEHIIKSVFTPHIESTQKLADFGGDAQENAALFLELFKNGTIDHPVSQTVALNAAAALYIAGKAENIQKAYPKALAQIQNKEAYYCFENYKRLAQ